MRLLMNLEGFRVDRDGLAALYGRYARLADRFLALPAADAGIIALFIGKGRGSPDLVAARRHGTGLVFGGGGDAPASFAAATTGDE